MKISEEGLEEKFLIKLRKQNLWKNLAKSRAQIIGHNFRQKASRGVFLRLKEEEKDLDQSIFPNNEEVVEM